MPIACMLIFSPGPEAVDSVEHLKIVATVTNTGDETLKVLNDPRGPLNNIPTDTFVITDAKGSQPSFTGIKLKYVPKTAAALEAYSILAPGESVVVGHDRKCHLGSSSLACCSPYNSYAPSCSCVQFYHLWSCGLRYPREEDLLHCQPRLHNIDSPRKC